MSTVSGGGSNLQHEIDTADDGDTLTITDSKTYDPITIGNDLTIESDSGVQPTIDASGTSTAVDVTGSVDLTIEGLTIDGADQQRVIQYDVPNNADRTLTVKDCVIKVRTSSSTFASGIFTHHPKSVVITDNDITTVGGKQPFSRAAFILDALTKVVVKNNSIADLSIGFQTVHSSNVVHEGNTYDTISNSAVIADAGSGSEHFTATDNAFSNVGRGVIFMDNSGDWSGTLKLRTNEFVNADQSDFAVATDADSDFSPNDDTLSSVTVDAEKNYWGDPSGPGGEGRGSGGRVDKGITFEPWYTMESPMSENVQLESNGTTIALSEDIQSAVDAAESDESVIADGITYAESVTIDVNGLTLTSKDPAAPAVIETSNGSTGITVEADAVVIRDLTVDGTTSSDATAIEIDNSDNTLVEALDIDETSTGISVGGTSNTLRNNEITVNPVAGIILQTNAAHTIIELNLITTATGSSGGDGILVKDVNTGNLVALNDIAENPPAGFENAVNVESGGNPTGVKIHFNDIRGNTNGAVNNASGTLDARSNFWDHKTGPAGGVDDPNTGRTATGTGEIISTGVAYDPFLEINNGFILETGTPDTGRDVTGDGQHEIFEDRTDEENGQPEDDDGDGYHPTDGYLFRRHFRQGHFQRLGNIEPALSQTYTPRFDINGDGSVTETDIVQLVLERTA